MAKAASHMPDGVDSLTVHLFVNGARECIEFLKRAFDAVEISRSPSPTGKLIYAEMKIGDAHFIFADDFGEEFQMPAMAVGRLPFYLQRYLPDGDAAFARAVSAGCTPVPEPMDMFWGDRFAQVKDRFGITWAIATRLEDLTLEEVADRQAKLFAGASI